MKTVKDIADIANIPTDPPKKVLVKSLKCGQTYQRPIQPSRLKRIKESISYCGWWNGEVIYITPENYIIDGQHRVEAARLLNIETIPACVVHTTGVEQEARFYIAKNSFSTALQSVDKIHARIQDGDELACLVDALNKDPNSLLRNRISLRGSRGPNKFAPSQTLNLILVIGLGICDLWCEEKHGKFKAAAARANYCDVLERMNAFICWFDACFLDGRDKEGTPAYHDCSTRCISWMYAQIIEMGFFSGKNGKDNYRRSILRMRSYIFPREWSRMSHLAKMDSLRHHWNGSKKLYMLKTREVDEKISRAN